MKTRTLADYRPQHDNGCPLSKWKACQRCDWSPGNAIHHGMGKDAHDLIPFACSCGLEALLSGAQPRPAPTTDEKSVIQQAADALLPFSWIGDWLFARDLPDEEVMVDVVSLGPHPGLTRGHFKAASNARKALLVAACPAPETTEPKKTLRAPTTEPPTVADPRADQQFYPDDMQRAYMDELDWTKR